MENSANIIMCRLCKLEPGIVDNHCCGSRFCWTCILEPASCSVCHQKIVPERCTEDETIKKLVGDGLFPCKFAGCNELLNADSRQSHEKSCGNALGMCPNSHLCGILQKKELQEHLLTCTHRIVLCHLCEASVPVSNLPSHLESDCMEAVVTCVNGCKSDKIPRRQMEAHILNDCLRTVVNCSFSRYGCTHEGARQDVDAHLRDDVSSHLNLAVSVLEVQGVRIVDLQERINAALPPHEEPHCDLLSHFNQSMTSFCSQLQQIQCSPSSRGRFIRPIFLVMFMYMVASFVLPKIVIKMLLDVAFATIFIRAARPGLGKLAHLICFVYFLLRYVM